jgi:hypothetical protein
VRDATKNRDSLHGSAARSHAARSQGASHQRERSPLVVLALTLGGAAVLVVVGLVPLVADAAEIGPGVTVEVADTPYPSNSGSPNVGKCAEGRDGWHITMNGLATSDGQPVTAEDFGSVNLAFSDGTAAQAWFTDLSGRTAHFLNDTENQQGSFTVIGATMTLPNDTRITSFEKFAIKNAPCNVSVAATTTSQLSAETTIPTNPVSTETTTTEPPPAPQSTSFYPAVTLPTTMALPDRSAGTGAVSAAVEPDIQVARIAQANPGSDPPSTTLDGRPFIAVGLLLIIAGGALWIYTQRRTAA